MYRISLDQFEGPLDLLLFFIRRDELDIYDIPVAQIADEFLAYVRVLEQVDLDRVGDFIYMAALLISIKARMLFPKQAEDEETEPEDPRRELVERLVEYLRYKEAGETLSIYHERRADQYTRPVILNAEKESAPESYSNATLFHLISSLKRLLAEAPEEPTHAVGRVDYTVEEQQAFLRVRLVQIGTASFGKLVHGRSKQFIIATFLAVLELARSGEVAIHVEAAADFSVEPLILYEETTGQAA